jgi:hypothetical protein
VNSVSEVGRDTDYMHMFTCVLFHTGFVSLENTHEVLKLNVTFLRKCEIRWSTNVPFRRAAALELVAKIDIAFHMKLQK